MPLEYHYTMSNPNIMTDPTTSFTLCGDEEDFSAMEKDVNHYANIDTEDKATVDFCLLYLIEL